MPPRSQIDRSSPHSRQRAIHARDSASIEAAQERGTIEVTSLWIKLIFPPSRDYVCQRLACSAWPMGCQTQRA